MTIPLGGQTRAHLLARHETAIYLTSGKTTLFRGDRLQHWTGTVAGKRVCIPADMPHLPVNLGAQPATAVIARTDPSELESVTLLPELELLVP